MTGALFDLEPHGTPCLICGALTCVCRAAGTLEAQPGAWPIDRPADSEQAQPARRPDHASHGWML